MSALILSKQPLQKQVGIFRFTFYGLWSFCTGFGVRREAKCSVAGRVEQVVVVYRTQIALLLMGAFLGGRY